MMNADLPTLEQPCLPSTMSPRRADIESKQLKIARLLADANCEGLLLLEPANFRWMTSGASMRGAHHADECPVLFVNPTQRWVLCSSTDTQRLFDEELDSLGFQVKEWPWAGNREQFFAELFAARKMACDRSFKDYTVVGTFLDQERRRLGRFEQERLRELGKLLVHALEATARNLKPGDSEEEVAGHLAHRLLKRGAEPAALQIAADDRPRSYRRPGYTAAAIGTRCLLQATVSKFGLFATASRTVSFGGVEDPVKQEIETACRLQAVWQAALKNGDRLAALFDTVRTVLKNTPYEHEFRLSTPGWWTGRLPVEASFLPAIQDKFVEGQAVVWQSRIGGIAVCDTFLLEENGFIPITTVEDWPVRRYVIQGARFERPDLLIRNLG